MLVAAALTALILLAYGGYAAWNAVISDDGSPESALPTGRGYLASVERATYDGSLAILMGVNVRLISDIAEFQARMEQLITDVGTEHANLEARRATSQGARADIVDSSVQATDALAVGMRQWRDAIVNLRLGNVETAQSAIDGAITQLRADMDRWRALGS